MPCGALLPGVTDFDRDNQSQRGASFATRPIQTTHRKTNHRLHGVRRECRVDTVNRSEPKHAAKLVKEQGKPKSQEVQGHDTRTRAKSGKHGTGGGSEQQRTPTHNTKAVAGAGSSEASAARGNSSAGDQQQGGQPPPVVGEEQATELDGEPDGEPARCSQAVATAIAKQRLKRLRRHFQGWRTHTEETTQKVVAFQTKATFHLLTCTWGIWKSHMHARQMKQKEGMLIAALANERKQLQIARDYNASRILANTFLAWQRWTKRRKWERDQSDANQKKKAKMQKLLHVLQQRTLENNARSAKGAGNTSTATANEAGVDSDAPGGPQGPPCAGRPGQGSAPPPTAGSPHADGGSKGTANPWDTNVAPTAAHGHASLQDQRLLVMKRVKAGETSIDQGLEQIAHLDAQKAAADGGKMAKPRASSRAPTTVTASLDFVEDEVIMLQGAQPAKPTAAPVNPLVARMEERAAQRQAAKEVRVQRQKEKQAREEVKTGQRRSGQRGGEATAAAGSRAGSARPRQAPAFARARRRGKEAGGRRQKARGR